MSQKRAVYHNSTSRVRSEGIALQMRYPFWWPITPAGALPARDDICLSEVSVLDTHLAGRIKSSLSEHLDIGDERAPVGK